MVFFLKGEKRMKWKNVLWVTGLALSVVVPAWASTTTPLISHEHYSVGQGDLQVKFDLNPNIIRGDASTEIVTLGLGANYFLTDIWAPGLDVRYEHVTGANTFRFLPNVKAYWPGLGRTLPYAQVAIGYTHVFGDDCFDFGIGPGIDYLLSNTVAIGAQFRYDLAVGNNTFHDIQFPIGFQIYFKL